MIKVYDYKPTFKKTVLKNGVVVVTEHHPNTRATCASIFIKIGTRDEPSSMTGAAHFLEHLVFKGTKKRSGLQIAQSLESVGGDLNAYTTREYTCFHTTSLREHLPLSIDILSDLVSGAQCTNEDFNKEREVVLQEIDMSSDELEEYIFDLFFEHSFKGNKLGLPILGTETSLKKMTKSKVNEFYRSHYRGKNLIVAVAGDVDHDEVVRLCKRNLSRGFAVPPKKRKKPLRPNVFVKHEPKPSEQLHVLMGFPSVGYKDSRRFDAYMLNAIMGGGMTSRLYQKVREKTGWVYSVYSYLNTFTDTGLLTLYAGTSNEYLEKVIGAFYKEIEVLNKKGISKRELEFFKKQVQGQIVLGADDIENRMTSLAVNEMIFKSYRPVEQILSEIDAVDVGSVNDYIDDFLDVNKMGVLTLGDR